MNRQSNKEDEYGATVSHSAGKATSPAFDTIRNEADKANRVRFVEKI